jgi:ribosomal protein L12E/L44/L45/RPP1/RPP2
VTCACCLPLLLVHSFALRMCRYEAHCACASQSLFAAADFDFRGSEAYCCGDSNCQGAVLRFFAGAAAHADPTDTAPLDTATGNLDGLIALLSGSCAAVRCSAGPGPADGEEQEEEDKEAKEEDEEEEEEEDAADFAYFSAFSVDAAPTKRSRASVSQSLGHRSAISARASAAAAFSFSYSYESLPPPSHGPSPVPSAAPFPLPTSLPAPVPSQQPLPAPTSAPSATNAPTSITSEPSTKPSFAPAPLPTAPVSTSF